jgi:hypothetical protein
MGYNYVTVTGSFPSRSGTITFAPVAEVTDLTGTIPVLGPGALSYPLSGGSFTTAPLLATDNLGLRPAAWNWQITVALNGERAYTYPVLIPGSAGTAATLSSLPVSASAGGSGAVASVTAGDGSIVVSGTTAAPVIETGTLDVIATGHPPAASVPMNSQKITALARGASATDSANLGQILAAAQSGGMTGLGYVGGMSSVASGAAPVAPLLKWTNGALWGQLVFTVPGVSVNGYVTLAPWGGGTLSSAFVAVYNSSGTQLGMTADLGSVSTNGRGIRVALPGFTATPADGKIYMLYTNATLANNAGPYLIPGETYQNGYPTGGIPSNINVMAFSQTGPTTMPGSLTFGANGIPSGFNSNGPFFYQAFLD